MTSIWLQRYFKAESCHRILLFDAVLPYCRTAITRHCRHLFIVYSPRSLDSMLRKWAAFDRLLRSMVKLFCGYSIRCRRQPAQNFVFSRSAILRCNFNRAIAYFCPSSMHVPAIFMRKPNAESGPCFPCYKAFWAIVSQRLTYSERLSQTMESSVAANRFETGYSRISNPIQEPVVLIKWLHK